MKKNLFRKGFMVLLACMSLLFAYSVCAYAAENDVIKNDQSGIPDKGLYRAVQDALGKKRSQTFTEKEAASLKKLEIPFRYKIGIKSLKGIEYLSNLERLDISGYGLKSLKGIEKLPKLTFLAAEGNHLKNLTSISKAKSLRAICVESNKLKSLKGIENLTNLTFVCVSNNQLTSLKELRHLRKLKEIEANENELTNLTGLGNLKALESLKVSHNQIKSLKGIKNLRKIDSLDISFNQVKSLGGLKCLPNLRSLDAGYNQLKKLPNLRNNKKMRSIYSCNVKVNYLDEDEIRSKLPKKFFRKGRARKLWLETQLYYQNVPNTIEFMIPADGKISKDTTKIVGKAHRNASIFLENTTKNLWIGPVTADENGVFTMDELDLSTWAGDTARFGYYESELEEIQFPEFTIQQ